MAKPRQARWVILAIPLIVCAAPAQTGMRDATFSRVSFDRWRAEGKSSPFHWSVDVVEPQLSSFQRIVTGVQIAVDAPELVNHHAQIFIDLEDSEGGAWQTHGTLRGQPEYTRYAFILPGEYTVSVAMFDPVTLKHGFVEKKLHVAPLKSEPLPGAWDNLPRVEFVPDDTDAPESWYLPSATGRLHIPVATERPVRVDVLVNTTPSDTAVDSGGELRRNLNVLLPTAKVLSQMELSNGTVNLALLDLVHHRDVPVSGWSEMRDFLTRTNPEIIDVHALDDRSKMRGFLLDRVAKRATGGAARVVIVLSGPAFLKDQEPVTNFDLPADAEHRVFYIRCRLIPHSMLTPRPRPRPGARPQPPRFRFYQLPLDDLQKPLDNSSAMLFDVITPEQMRRVLASVIGQISRL